MGGRMWHVSMFSDSLNWDVVRVSIWHNHGVNVGATNQGNTALYNVSAAWVGWYVGR